MSQEFIRQRNILVNDIAHELESVLDQLNILNRGLEGAIQVGKEFDAVATLWANFYQPPPPTTTMGDDNQQQQQDNNNDDDDGQVNDNNQDFAPSSPEKS